MLRKRRTVLGLAALLALLVAACGGGGASGSDRDARQADEAPTVAASTPIPTQSGPPLIRTSLEGTCRLTPAGAQIRVQYSVMAFGSTSLTRVRLLQDGKQVEDSGELEQRSYSRVATIDAQPGEQHTYRVTAESVAGQAPNAQTTVRCGREPTPSPGPRA